MKKSVICLFLSTILTIFSLCTCSTDKRATEEQTTDYYKAETTTTAEQTEESVHKEISFAACGDNLIYQAGLTDAQTFSGQKGVYDFSPYYSDIKDMISSADIAFINQETIMAGQEYGYSDYPQFNSPQSLLDDLIDVGFDIVSMANNHMLDMGSQGLADAISYYKTKSDKITMIGGYEDENDFMTPRVIEKDGVKIGLLAFTYSANGYQVREGYDLYVPFIDDEDIIRAIEQTKKVSDCIIVSMHWGEENNPVPTDEQVRLAQLLADNGVLAVIGQHPHVLQPIEYIEGKDGNQMLCAYSLGDLIAVMTRASNMLSGVLTFDIVQDGDTFTTENVMLNPTLFHFGPSYYNGHIYWLKDFDSDLSSTFGKVYGISVDYNDLVEMLTDYIGIDTKYLPDYITDNDY